MTMQTSHNVKVGASRFAAQVRLAKTLGFPGVGPGEVVQTPARGTLPEQVEGVVVVVKGELAYVRPFGRTDITVHQIDAIEYATQEQMAEVGRRAAHTYADEAYRELKSAAEANDWSIDDLKGEWPK